MSRPSIPFSLILGASFLVLQPLLGMQPTEQAAIRYLSRLAAQKKLFGKNIPKETALAMTPAAATTVVEETTKDPSTINTAVQLGGAIATSIGAPPLLVALGLGAVWSYFTYKAPASNVNDGTSFIAPTPEEYEASKLIDPITGFNVYPGDPGYAKLKANLEGPAFAFTDEPLVSSNNPYPNQSELIEISKHASTIQLREHKKPSKAQLEKEAKKNGGGSVGGPKKPEDEKKERKENPHDFKQRVKNKLRKDYETQSNGRMRLRDNGKALKDAKGKEIHEIDSDFRHKDIECYDKHGKHLGSLDPVTMEVYKNPVTARKITRVVVPVAAPFLSIESKTEEPQEQKQEIKAETKSEEMVLGWVKSTNNKVKSSKSSSKPSRWLSDDDNSTSSYSGWSSSYTPTNVSGIYGGGSGSTGNGAPAGCPPPPLWGE